MQMTVNSPGIGKSSEVGFVLHDIVRLASGQQLIITGQNLHRPANPYSGVLVNGKGKGYKFGPKHRPVKIGHAEPDHPALQAAEARGPSRISGETLQTVRRLVDLVKHGQGGSDVAKGLATILSEVL